MIYMFYNLIENAAMKNSSFLLPIMVILAIIWFIVTWMYISLEIYDVSQLQDWAYKILHFRERFIEIALIIWMFAFGFCLWSFFCGNDEEKETENFYGFEPKKWGEDNLQVIEWIGPKIDQALRSGGINSFKKLRDASPKEIIEILKRWGKQFGLANPTTWPEQADLAFTQRWRELKEYQDFLVGGL